MPNIANLTIKKKDGVTDILWTAVQPSGGDRSPSVWRSLTVGTMTLARPEFRLVARANGTGSARRVESLFVYPYVITGADGKPYVADKFIFSGSGLAPAGMPDTDVGEAAYQCMNLHYMTLVKDCFQSGFAAT